MNSEKLILMIEDSDEDFIATERVLRKSGYDVKLKRTVNAGEALDFLNRGLTSVGKRNSLSAPTPALILLDLNLPGMDGRELLSKIKVDDRFKQIPVVILTTSNNPRDISYCYQHGASSYHIKSVGFEKFSASLKMMLSYWFKTVTLPSSIN